MADVAPTSPDTAGWRWVLIESGSNQDYIFRSPRRRYSVGASALLLRVAQWVRDAAAALVGKTDVVVATSSKALVLVDSVLTGQELIATVTGRALVEAPGLDLWGVVEEDDHLTEDLTVRQARLHELHSEARYERPTPHRRSLLLPFLQPCALTGVAASVMDATGEDGQRHPVSSQAQLAVAAAGGRHAKLTKTWPGHALGAQDDVSGDGWLAIVHADGNRVGDLITSVDSVERMKAVSKELTEATKTALTAAIKQVGGDEPQEPWILPLIVGGDDVTALVDGRKALRFAESYLKEFELATSQCPNVSALAKTATNHGYVTASAGIVACHTSTPFSLAYALVEDVLAKAKAVRRLAPGRSAFSFFLAGDSVPAGGEADGSASVPSGDSCGVSDVRRRAGLYVVPQGAAPKSDSAIIGASQPWVDAHSSTILLDAVDALLGETPPISGSQRSGIRMELGRGRLTKQTLDRVLSDGPAARGFVDRHLVVEVPNHAPITRWLDIYEATSLARGKTHVDAEPADITPEEEQ